MVGTAKNGGGRTEYFTVKQRLTNHIAKPFHLCDIKISENKMRIGISEFCLEDSQVAVQKNCRTLDMPREKSFWKCKCGVGSSLVLHSIAK